MSSFIPTCQSNGSQPTTTEHWPLEKVPPPSLPSVVAPASPSSQGETSSYCRREVAHCGPNTLHKVFLHMAHSAAGHQGTDKTIARLSDFTYWVGMAKDAGHYCTHCVTCQMAKAPTRPPASLQPMVTSKPWEMVGIDILKVCMSSKGNQYLLVAQDHLSK